MCDYDNAIFRLATAQETEPEDYIGEDGLLYCGKCRQPKEAYFPEGKTLFGRDRHPRACDCKRKILDEQQAAEDIRRHFDTVERLKRKGFTDPAMREWNFDNDNGKCPQMEFAREYVEQWGHMKAENHGLLLWGNVGTGKSFFAGCIANALMKLEVPVCMTNFALILNDLAANFKDRNEYIARLCSQTVQSGSVSKGKGESSQSLQMVERPLMTPDELKSIPKGQFVVMKTGTHPMQTRLRLFLDWGITFGEQYQTPDHGKRKVYYADRRELEAAILKKYPPARVEIVPPPTSQAAPRPRPRPSTRPTEGDSSPVRP